MTTLLSLNKLDEAATYLTKATGKEWTPRGILAHALANPTQRPNGDPLPSWISVAPPITTRFLRCKFDALETGTPYGPFVPQNPMPWSLVQLYQAQIGELLACDCTTAAIATRPQGEEITTGDFVILEQELTVTVDMLRIPGHILEAIVAEHGSCEPEQFKHPVQRSKAQEDAIIAALGSLGVQPESLPPTPEGKPGIKSKVWTIVEGDKQTFISRATFDKAWQRLRDQNMLSENNYQP